MSILRHLKAAAACFLGALLGGNPALDRLNRPLIRMPAVCPLAPYPQPNRRPSGVAKARRAARKRRKAKS